MADFPAMPLFTDAYLADTVHLTTEEHGAYLLLLIAAWRAPDCCLRDDDRFLARIAKVSHERWIKRIKPVIAPFWQIVGGVWIQKKQQKIRQNLQIVSQKRAAAARKGRDAKSLTSLDDAAANETAREQQRLGYPKPESKTRNLPPLLPQGRVDALEAEFDGWWKKYPRKVGRAVALRCYLKARQEVSAGVLSVGLASANRKWKLDKIKDRYIPHPANWLEQKRWEDDVAPAELGPSAVAEPIELTKLCAGALLATQDRRRFEALLKQVGQDQLTKIVRANEPGRDTRDLFLTVERAVMTGVTTGEAATRTKQDQESDFA